MAVKPTFCKWGTMSHPQKDRVALPPVTAQKTNMTCHCCIVGCGYHVDKWPENTEGGCAPHQNALGLDFRKQLPPFATTMTTAMTNVVTDADGKRYNIMIVPDKDCVVNSGLSFTRGGKMASYMYTPDGITADRLTEPRLYTGAQWVDTTWDEALAIYAGLVKKILDKDGPDPIMLAAFDHGGAICWPAPLSCSCNQVRAFLVEALFFDVRLPRRGGDTVPARARASPRARRWARGSRGRCDSRCGAVRPRAASMGRGRTGPARPRARARNGG